MCNESGTSVTLCFSESLLTVPTFSVRVRLTYRLRLSVHTASTPIGSVFISVIESAGVRLIVSTCSIITAFALPPSTLL